MRLLLFHISIFGLLFFRLPIAEAQDNTLSLSKEAVEDLAVLETTWQFHYGDLLSAAQMDSLPDKVFVDVPSTWDEYPKDYSNTGVAIYYLKIVLQEPVTDVAINARITGLNYKLFANDEFLGELGKVGDSPETSIPKYQNIIYPIQSERDTLRIVYQISNFHYRKGGMWRAPFFGTEEALRARKEKKLIVDFFLMGAIVFMGIYHLALNIFRHKNKLAFYFAFVCFLTALRSASVGEFVLVEYFDWSWWVVTRLEFISFFLLLGFMARFIYHLFPESIPKRIAQVPYYFGLVSSVLVVFLPLYYSSFIIPYGQALVVLTGIVYLYFIGKQAWGKRSMEARVAFVGFTVLFMSSVFEIAMHNARLTGDVVFATGIFLYLFSHVIIIAYRTSKDYQKTEELSEALQSLNMELESKVEQRTQQLDKRNDDLEKANKTLLHMNNEKDGILHVVAHDLKSPLNTSIGLSEVLKNSGEIKNQQHLQYLDMLKKVNKQGLKFINDLLVMYQFEGAYEAELRSFNVVKLMDLVVERFHSESSRKAIQIKTNFNINEEFRFCSDPDILSRIIDNLLSNALKYSYSGSEITVYCSINAKEEMCVAIEDQGQGIPESEHDKVFQKFQKISTRPTDNETSSGLGLSIVKQLIEILGGEISFKSKVGKGSTFYFNVPSGNC